jgi:hypothetical protein
LTAIVAMPTTMTQSQTGLTRTPPVRAGGTPRAAAGE